MYVSMKRAVLPQKRKSEEQRYGTVMGRPFHKGNGQAGL